MISPSHVISLRGLDQILCRSPSLYCFTMNDLIHSLLQLSMASKSCAHKKSMNHSCFILVMVIHLLVKFNMGKTKPVYFDLL